MLRACWPLFCRPTARNSGSLLFGPDTIVKVLLLDHKDTVAEMLIAAAQQNKP